jgi:hypothetical protein
LDWPPAGPAYSALTASSKLVRLSTWHAKLPAGVRPYVFPASHTLPHLTYLSLSFEGAVRNAPPSAWGAADVSSLVACCPNLQMIVDCSVRPGMHVSELHKLTAFTNLHVTYGPRSVPSIERSVMGLAALTQLRCLTVSVLSEDLSVGSLLPLTTLTNLVDLDFTCARGDDEDSDSDVSDNDSDSGGRYWEVYLTEVSALTACQRVIDSM